MIAERNIERPTRIAVLGAGFGGVYAFKHLHRHFHKDANVELVLINDTNYFLFTPLLHEVATGNVNPEHVVEPLRKILGCCMAEFHMGQVEKVDTKRRVVETSEGEVQYDYLTLALGAQINYFGAEGAEAHGYPLKTLDDAVRIKNRCIAAFERASHIYTKKGIEARNELERLLHFVVVGGGPTGVELAAELDDLFFHTFVKHYPKELMGCAQISLVQSGDELLPHFPAKLRARSLEVFRKRGINVHFNRKVVAVTPDFARLDSEDIIESNTVLWTAGQKPMEVPLDIEVQKNRGKFITNRYLQLVDHPRIYALGDLAYHEDVKTGEPLPALAQVATRQAKGVADNIAADIRGAEVTPFHYKHKGLLVSLGRWRAAGEVENIHLYGRFAWWLWRTIYLSKLISKAKQLKVVGDWTLHIFMPRDISQLYRTGDEFKQAPKS